MEQLKQLIVQNDQGKFWEYHDELYNNYSGENNGWASSENLVKFAQNIGLNQEEFVECMTDKKYRQLVSGSSADARNLGITGTPAFFVIGQTTKLPEFLVLNHTKFFIIFLKQS